MRLFVSVDLPGPLAESVAEIQAPLHEAAGLTLPDPAQAHLTLKFLGETPRSRVGRAKSAIQEAVDEVDLEPFEATFGGVGAFPSTEYIRVVWLGVRDGGEELTRLHESIEERLVSLGFEPEDHDFTPHVTLARMNHAASKALVQGFLEDRDPTAGSMTVEEVCLTESERSQDGPVYSTVERFPLA